ncbi:uncharacterized protein TM35_000016460 [Trypanosoma theileri]|uniref:Uncharacterized protein n=1 Tax=Trypanosoma theileri TaxID=67003 RepID=A0A1X0PB12_9TRYP|nr:uncharacterized protein TM35_000016460 [Trypanosoma theileri]ORC93769.1 hypothetical protein TM35_000016460 [Trypanosoma theileri]
MNGDYTAPLLSRGEFEALKHDPLLILARATEAIAGLQQREAARRAEATELQRLVEAAGAAGGTDPTSAQRERDVMDATAELERDHRQLAVRCTEMELTNKRLTEVVDELRREKDALLKERTELQSTQNKLDAQYTDTLNKISTLEKLIPDDTAKIKGLQDIIDKKITSLDELTKEVLNYTNKSSGLQKKVEKLGCERLTLEAETVALEQTTRQQERTINYLQHESTQLDDEINKKTTELVEMKKQMSAMLLELQLQITRAEEEMTRLQNAVSNEKNLTGRQNLWQAKELHAKTEDLLTTRQEMTQEHGKLKTELSILQEKVQRLKNNALVVEKQNQVMGQSLQQLEDEDEFARSSYAKRKDEAFEESTKQSATVQQLNAELQKARENLYMMKSKVCKDCRTSIFPSEVPDTSIG